MKTEAEEISDLPTVTQLFDGGIQIQYLFGSSVRAEDYHIPLKTES